MATIPKTDTAETFSLLPILKRKYMTSMIILVILAVLLPSYLGSETATEVQKAAMIGVYVAFILTFLILFGLYKDFFWAKLNRHWRPFLMARYAQYIITLSTIASVVLTVSDAVTTKQWGPYIFFWILSFFLCYQFYDIFHTAHDAKTKHPDRCEFC